jgi:hypothetical protein
MLDGTATDPADGTGIDSVDIFNLVTGETCFYYDCAADDWPSNNNVDVVPCQGYKVYKLAPETICVYFDPATGSVSPPKQDLCEGWNLIGHIDTTEMPIYEEGNNADFGSVTTLEGKFAQIQHQTESGWEYYPVDTGFTHMIPGHGYWILITEDDVTMYGTL